MGELQMASNRKRPSNSASKARWDVFISHASEDKKDFVEPLATALKEFGLKVWYDRFTLSLGDSLSRSIDEGLVRSRFGLVVLSPSFFAKKYPEYELRGLTAREMVWEKVILPIWHKINQEDILRFSPPLADKLAVDSKGLSPLQIAIQIIKVIRPDLFGRIAIRRAHLEALQNATIEYEDPRTIISSPIQHPNLSPELVARIRLVRAVFLCAHPHSMDNWLDGFKRDSHPSKEVEVWERLAAVYLECCSLSPDLSPGQHRQLFALILAIDMRSGKNALTAMSTQLPERVLEDALRAYRSDLPVYDFVDDKTRRSGDPIDSSNTTSRNLDKEYFPNDVPDHLIQKIIAIEKAGSSSGK
jgi:hypothetical protein